MNKINKVLFLNQMAGPLFRELSEDLSASFPENSELYTGHPDTLKCIGNCRSLNITKSPTYNRKSYFTRILSWLSYTVFAFFKVLFTPKTTLLFIVSNPPLLGPVALIAKKLRGISYVVLVYDIHPETLVSFGVLKRDSIVTKAWSRINRAVWENADAVYTIGDVMAKKLGGQFDVSRTKLKHVGVVPPWADTNLIKPIDKVKNPLAEEFDQTSFVTVLYSGNMGISHDIDSMLRAAHRLVGHTNIKFLFIGEGEKWQHAYDFVADNKLNNVQVLPFQAESRLPFTMALGDISLVALDEGAEGLMVPSKMYYYMAAGSAVIGICRGENDLENSLSIGDSGIVVAPGDDGKLASTILELANSESLLSHYKNNARKSSIEHFSREACISKLKSSLQLIDLIPQQ